MSLNRVDVCLGRRLGVCIPFLTNKQLTQIRVNCCLLIIFVWVAYFVAFWGYYELIVLVIVIVINHLHLHNIVRRIAVSTCGKVKQREGVIHLIDIMDDGIIAHGLVDALLLVQLELEMIVCVDVEIDASFMPRLRAWPENTSHLLSGTCIQKPTSNEANSRSMRMKEQGIRRS